MIEKRVLSKKEIRQIQDKAMGELKKIEAKARNYCLNVCGRDYLLTRGACDGCPFDVAYRELAARANPELPIQPS